MSISITMKDFQRYDNYSRSGQLNPSAYSAAQIPQPQTPAQPTQKSTDLQSFEKNIATAGILQLVAMGLNKLSQGAGYALMKGKEFTSAENATYIANEMLEKNKLNVAVEYIKNTAEHVGAVAKRHRIAPETLVSVAKGQNAFFTDTLKLAVAPANRPSWMLHELGHACNAKNFLLKGLQSSRVIACFVPTALVLLNSMNPNKDNNKRSFIEKNAGKIGFLAFLPTIIEEGVASIRGINAAKTAQSALGKLNLKPLMMNSIFAWSTYLLAGVGLGVASRLAFVESKNIKAATNTKGLKSI